MFGKSVWLLAFLVSIAVIVNAAPNPYYALNRVNNGSHHLIAGARVDTDRLVLSQPVYKAATNQYVSIQAVFSVGMWETITLLQALDDKGDNTGAYPSIVAGGPGTNNVTIRFQSTRRQPINFVVELYARP